MEQIGIFVDGCERYSLSVGDRFPIGRIVFNEDGIIYAGMPNAEIFSLIYSHRESLFRKTTGNLFFPISQKRLSLSGTDLEVLSVDSNQISLAVKGFKPKWED